MGPILVTPELVDMVYSDIARLKAWAKRHGFFGLSGIALWLYLFIKGIIWLFVHVRFV